jgi:diketogulonate reductase-like aldo/keto reductase
VAIVRSGSRQLRGLSLPAFLYGTAWKEERTEALTSLALSAGFDGIDTANQRRHYFEAGVGAAVAEAISSGRSSRDQLFLQTKFTYVTGQDHRLPYDPAAPIAAQVEQSFASSLEHLRTDRIDSYLLHGPQSRTGLKPADYEAWRAMEALVRAGKTRLIGVSNVALEQLRSLYDFAEIKPAFVQNRCFAKTGWDRAVRAFCDQHDLIYQGFSLLTANQKELASPAVSRVVSESGRSLAEVVFRFAIQVGMLPLTGTTKVEHMRLDLGCLNFELSPKHVSLLEQVAERG